MMRLNEENPWQSAREDFRLNVLPELERKGHAIGQSARAGDQKAARVIELYTMLHRSFDPMTLELLKDAMRELADADALALALEIARTALAKVEP